MNARFHSLRSASRPFFHWPSLRAVVPSVSRGSLSSQALFAPLSPRSCVLSWFPVARPRGTPVLSLVLSLCTSGLVPGHVHFGCFLLPYSCSLYFRTPQEHSRISTAQRRLSSSFVLPSACARAEFRLASTTSILAAQINVSKPSPRLALPPLPLFLPLPHFSLWKPLRCATACPTTVDRRRPVPFASCSLSLCDINACFLHSFVTSNPL